MELWPFSQGEIDGAPDGFVDALFAYADSGALPTHHSDVGRAEYADRVVRGGFPEAVARPNQDRRERFFDSYVTDLITRPRRRDRVAHRGGRRSRSATACGRCR